MGRVVVIHRTTATAGPQSGGETLDAHPSQLFELRQLSSLRMKPRKKQLDPIRFREYDETRTLDGIVNPLGELAFLTPLAICWKYYRSVRQGSQGLNSYEKKQAVALAINVQVKTIENLARDARTRMSE
jgi:hypothetical protein